MRVLLSTVILVISLVSCQNPKLKTGDLLFVDNTSSDLTKAINDVTQKNGKANYTHVAICKEIEGELYVYHASTKKNVVKEPLKVFLSERVDSKIDAYRIQELSEKQIALAFQRAETLLGSPYDFAYIYGDQNIYCSELIYEMFKPDAIFTLNPMTFKDPKTGNFHASWVAHYKKLGVEIPEGQPGCNPNDMSKNQRLDFLFRLK